MTFPRLTSLVDLKIVFSLGNINDGAVSTGAFIVWRMDNIGQFCPNEGNAHKTKCVVRSTLAAETLSLEEGLEATFYYREMIEHILGLEPRTIKIEVYVDNESVIEAILTARLVSEWTLQLSRN